MRSLASQLRELANQKGAYNPREPDNAVDHCPVFADPER